MLRFVKLAARSSTITWSTVARPEIFDPELTLLHGGTYFSGFSTTEAFIFGLNLRWRSSPVKQLACERPST